MFPSGKHDDLLDATELALSQAMYGFNPYTEGNSAYEFSNYKSILNDSGRRRR
jgi:hypothetical protein